MEVKCGTYSETAPHEAIFHNNWKSEIAVLLQAHGADPNAGNMRGALHYTWQAGEITHAM
jgi:hypothetical protein